MARTSETTVHQLVDKRFVGITPDGMRVMIDGEAEAQTGMRPMQLLLNAVGACAGYDIVEMLRKRRLEVRGYEIELRGDRAEGTPSGFTRIHARHRFDVPGLDERTARRFAELGMTKYCSVAASLKADIDVEVELLHEPAPTGT
ncbi:MAG: OsmC family protein [Trueperaceae bacterium]|nr:OsmC family protein [Trueperaceae bacterium]